MGKAEIQGEMMNDAFEMAEDPNAAADAEDVYNGILGEIGLEYTAGSAAVPSSKINVAEQEEEKVDAGQEEDLEARLAALRMA